MNFDIMNNWCLLFNNCLLISDRKYSWNIDTLNYETWQKKKLRLHFLHEIKPAISTENRDEVYKRSYRTKVLSEILRAFKINKVDYGYTVLTMNNWKQSLKTISHQSVSKMSRALSVDIAMVSRNLQKIRIVKNLDKWVTLNKDWKVFAFWNALGTVSECERRMILFLNEYPLMKKNIYFMITVNGRLNGLIVMST